MLPLPAGRETSPGVGVAVYKRHRPERTLLYRLVQEYYPALAAHQAAQGAPLPACVERAFEDYVKCGRPEHGFMWVRFDPCHAKHLTDWTQFRLNACFQNGSSAARRKL